MKKSINYSQTACIDQGLNTVVSKEGMPLKLCSRNGTTSRVGQNTQNQKYKQILRN